MPPNPSMTSLLGVPVSTSLPGVPDQRGHLIDAEPLGFDRADVTAGALRPGQAALISGGGGQPVVTASSAGLPGTKACVSVGPPLLARVGFEDSVEWDSTVPHR